MLNTDKLEKLYRLATGKTRKQETVKESVNASSVSKIEKIKKNKAKFKGFYSDPYEAWVKWYQDSEKDIDANNANEVWKALEQDFPGSQEQARDWLKNDILQKVDSSDAYAREVKLRNRMTKAPSWMAEQMLPELARTSSAVSNQNTSKMKAVYKKLIKDKLSKMNLLDLDPEVPIDVHVDDAMKLELLGLLDSGAIYDGRFATTNNEGKVKPAFTLDMDQEDVTNIGIGPEGEMIKEVAFPVIHSLVSTAVSKTADTVTMDNKASFGAALEMMKSGDLDVSEWKNIMSLVEDKEGLKNAGISGIINKNPFMDIEDMNLMAFDIAEMEGELQ